MAEATSLPRLTSPDRLDRRSRYFTPQPVHVQGFSSHRDPIIGTTKPHCFGRSKSTLLPDIYQRNFNKNVRYEPRLLRIVDVRSGKTIPFKDKDGKLPKVSKKEENEEPAQPVDPRLQRSLSNIHERSVFEDTGYSASYYIIHPDWTSELHGRHSLSTKSKPMYSYENRPAVHPLSSYVEPLLEKRRKRDEYIKAMEQAKHINEHFSARQSAQHRALKPQTPRDTQGRYKAFTAY